MRILFTFAGGSGHFNPLAPIARAAQIAGHIVAFAGQHAMIPTVEAAGFTVFPTGKRNSTAPKKIPLRRVDTEREDRDLRDGFADRLARLHAADTIALCARWRPDLIVCDEVDFGAVIAAEKLGLPYATVLVISEGSFVRTELISESLNRARMEFGLPSDPELMMLSL